MFEARKNAMIIKFKKFVIFVLVLSLVLNDGINSFGSDINFNGEIDLFYYSENPTALPDIAVFNPVDLSEVHSPSLVGTYITIGDYLSWLKGYLTLLSNGILGEFCNDETAQDLFDFINVNNIGTPIKIKLNSLFLEKYNELKTKLYFEEIIKSEDHYFAENIYFMAWKIYKDFLFAPNREEFIQLLQDILKSFDINDLKLNYLQDL